MFKRMKTAKYNIPMYAALILFCLTLISVHLSSGLYAKYTTTSQGSDGARTIKFGDVTITETGDFNEDGKLFIAPGVNIKKDAEVSFTGSEAATYVFVEIGVSTHWTKVDNTKYAVKSGNDEMITWQIADGWTPVSSEEPNVYYREVAPNDTISGVDIIKDGIVNVSPNITRTFHKTLSGMNITFTAAAVQASGFTSPALAWASIKSK